MSTAAEKQHMGRVAMVPCVLCKHLGLGDTPAEVHHIIESGRRVSHYITVALCPEHHKGATGVHGLKERGFEAMYKLTALDLLAMTLEAIE